MERKTMAIFTFVNVALSVVAIGSGAIVLRGLLRGTLTNRWTVTFLQSSLIASVAELLSPAHHLHAIQEICMLSVYVSAVAVLAWLDFGLKGAWRSIFAFSIALVLYLNVAVVFLQF